MDRRLLTIAINGETDIVLARQRTRTIADVLGFDGQHQTRITTAVSEIVRNALEYAGGGRIEYWVRGTVSKVLDIVIVDAGPGIADLNAVLEGRHRSTTGMGVGITGARRLMDGFSIDTKPGKGTRVALTKNLSGRAKLVTNTVIKQLGDALAQQERVDPIAESRRQNQEMMLQLHELEKRREELEQLNQELSDTNRGVVALYAELEERADHLRRADQLKTRFLSNMSHEFRTPLNSILSLSRLLLTAIDGKLGTEQEKQVQFIRAAAENLTDLVNDLLDLARVEAGKAVVNAKEFGVNDLFGALRGMLRPILVGDRVDLIFEDASDVPLLVTDEGKVSQILRNFISNAIKFTERGEIRVWCEWDPETQHVTFNVKDTGVGIAPSDIAVIWEEFGQVPGKLQTRVKGTGLGLPLSRNLANLLGGTVGVDSAVGQGSNFWLNVPCNIRAAPTAAAPVWALDPDLIPVIILEDNPADAFSLERSLANSNYQALSATTIADAQRALGVVIPAAIILDVVLEGEESWRLLIELKQDVKTAHIPIIIVSSSQEERKARSFGADEYFHKPIEPAVLVAALDRMTGRNTVINVLLIDDEEVSRYLVRQLIPRGAFKLIEESSFSAGLAAAECARPDVILLDLNMPDADGFAALDQLSIHPSLRDVPVIITTSMVLNEVQQLGLKKAARTLSKFDLTTDVLVRAIRDVVERSEQEAA